MVEILVKGKAMKMFRVIGATLLWALPAIALAQGGAMNGTTGKPASINAVQVGGRDPSSNLQALKVDGSGALLTSSGASGATADQVQGNIASGATDSGNPVKVGGIVNTGAPSALVTGQRSDFWTTANGAVVVGGITVTGADGISNSLLNNMPRTSGTATGPLLVGGYLFNGTAWDRARGDTNGAYAVGNVASGASDLGNPVKVGGRYNSTLPTLTNGQRGDLQLNVAGGLITQLADNNGVANWFMSPGSDAHTNNAAGYVFYVRPNLFNGATWDRARGDANGMVVQPALSSTYWSYAAAASGIVNTTTAVTVKAAAGASVRNYVCTLNISHDTLGSATEIALRDGAAGAVMWRGRLQTAAVEGNSEVNFSPCLKGTANTLVEVVTLTAVTGGIYVNAMGYTGI